MEPTLPHLTLSPLPPHLDLWFEMLKQNIVRIRKNMSDDSSLQITRLNFRNTLTHLRLGWLMISEQKSKCARSAGEEDRMGRPAAPVRGKVTVAPAEHSGSCILNHDSRWDNKNKTDPDHDLDKLIRDKKKREQEERAWWEKDYCFAEFAHLAKGNILRACRSQDIPLKKDASLAAFLLAARLACKHPTNPTLPKNPRGWEKFKIANELFAKSLCQMIQADHHCLGSSQRRNLSHLLSRLQLSLGLIDSCTVA